MQRPGHCISIEAAEHPSIAPSNSHRFPTSIAGTVDMAPPGVMLARDTPSSLRLDLDLEKTWMEQLYCQKMVTVNDFFFVV